MNRKLFPGLTLLTVCLFLPGCVRTLWLREPSQNLIGIIHSPSSMTREQALLEVEVTKINSSNGLSKPLTMKLVETMKALGYLNIDTKLRDSTIKAGEQSAFRFNESPPTYKVEGSFHMVPGPYFGLLVVWDIIAAVPSVFTPIPIAGTYTMEVTLKITDGSTGTHISTTRNKVDYGLVGFSLWGFIGGIPHFASDLDGVLGFLLNRELQRLIALPKGERT